MSTPGDAELYVEIGRNCRQRFWGVYLMLAAAALLMVGVLNSMKMTHNRSDYTPVMGTIVAVGRDANNGETTMTSEFTDDAGIVHRDTQTAGYHYAPGEPEVGQRIEYLYSGSEYARDFYAFPRADRILQWFFGVPVALFVLCSVLASWVILRQRNFRRRLVRSGRREPGEGYTVRNRNVVIPFGNVHSIQTWRLQARYFEPTLFAYVDCHSDWHQAPAPELTSDSPLQPILIDPGKPSRYWLPLGPLAHWKTGRGAG